MCVVVGMDFQKLLDERFDLAVYDFEVAAWGAIGVLNEPDLAGGAFAGELLKNSVR